MHEQQSTMPRLGDPFPEIELFTTQGTMQIPSELEHSWFVLFSFSADFAPVCTSELVAFQARVDDFAGLGCRLIALSFDQVFSHITWIEWIREKLNVAISFPIAAAGESVAGRLGMLYPGQDVGPARSVFVVDAEGMVRVMLQYPEEIGRSTEEIVRTVKALQVADRQGATPADWPRNELIGDRVIVPPPTTVNAARERSGRYECFDWWFCHKSLE